jgi:ppGpp synthetase/RelA/SpoT-type nucleotidyltranferase
VGMTGFGYGEFGAWYDAYRSEVLEPTLEVAMEALEHQLVEQLTDRDVARLRSIGGRVKSKRRTWRKLRQPRYRDQINSVDDIPAVIDDLVGLRVTCTNLRDLDMVQVALDGLPKQPSPKRPLSIDESSERDYVESPKESGYRGWHVNLRLMLESTSVTCELQVRTLLQDSWGELTHEDSYSKAGELPPLVEILSKRMADLLATLDDIAEDLRSELDRIDEAAVDGADDHPDESQVDERDLSAIEADAAELLADRWHTLDRPTELSSLAWELQKEFGAEVSDDWFGHRSFKRFLRLALPAAELSTGRHVYLLPPTEPEAVPDLESAAVAPEVEAPREAAELRRVDRTFPVIGTEQWVRIYEQLADAWRRLGTRTPSKRTINELTRSARDRAATTGEPVSRRHLDHVAKVVVSTSGAGEPLDSEAIADRFATATLQRLVDLRVIAQSSTKRKRAIREWLGASDQSVTVNPRR